MRLYWARWSRNEALIVTASSGTNQTQEMQQIDAFGILLPINIDDFEARCIVA